MSSIHLAGVFCGRFEQTPVKWPDILHLRTGVTKCILHLWKLLFTAPGNSDTHLATHRYRFLVCLTPPIPSPPPPPKKKTKTRKLPWVTLQTSPPHISVIIRSYLNYLSVQTKLPTSSKADTKLIYALIKYKTYFYDRKLLSEASLIPLWWDYAFKL